MRWTSVLVTLGLAAARIVNACPVCFDSSDSRVLREYSISTMFLSGLPFCIMGGLALAAWHLRRQALAQQRNLA